MDPLMQEPQYDFGIAAKKAISQVGVAAVSMAAAKASGKLSAAGIALDPVMVAGGLFAALNVLRNLLKVKLPRVFGWL